MRILTGIQPTNLLHVGNYFGALKPAVDLQKENELVLMVVDLHAMTVPQKPAELSKNIAFATAAYLAAGIDPSKTILFQQSMVPAHAELGWILQTVARMGELERMTQFKDKSTGKGQNVSVGLFTYPVLMAADILLYNTQGVPVGDDQKQHMELTRDLAERFNRDFGETFTVPKPLLQQIGGKILGLDNPEKKMSKSASSPKNYISLMDDAGTIQKKIKAAVTDSDKAITVDEGRPGLYSLISLYHLISGEAMTEIAARYDGKGMKDLKEDLAEALIAHLSPLQAKINSYLEQPVEMQKILQNGALKANAIAQEKMVEIKKKVGLQLS